MRLLQYPILACLLICMIAGDEGDENHPRPGSPRKPMPQNMRRGTPAGKRSPVAKNPGGHGGRRERCTFRLERTNCAGALFVRRWTYNEDTNTCESIHFPICWNKSRMFLTCPVCMNTCVKGNQRDPERSRWIQKFCEKSMNKHLQKHSLN
uniref:Pancreatic trypsin inhibitor n=1 Tax=Rhipicephalus zambeziensis TaxID=60191 RepID=A0A224Y2B3_9ACAR